MQTSANGIEIYYERGGSAGGPRLLFFNGSTSTLATSQLLVDVFRAEFDVLAHDQRGLGLTGKPRGPYTMADYATDAAGLLDAVGWDTCRVVGISFGGMVAQEFAATFPERVERLALVCTSPGGDHASYPLHTLEALSAAERADLSLRLLDTRFTPAYIAENESARAMAAMMSARFTGEKSPETARGEREQLLARSRHDVTARLAAITAPTLVASGRYDGIAPLANGEAIAARIPNATLKVYDGGHAFFAQDPTAFPDVVAFLRG